MHNAIRKVPHQVLPLLLQVPVHRHLLTTSGALQLPVYVPSEEESRDPHLYARNVRSAMMRFGGFGSSDSNLQECRAYIALLEGTAPPLRSTAGQALLQGQKLPADLYARIFPRADHRKVH